MRDLISAEASELRFVEPPRLLESPWQPERVQAALAAGHRVEILGGQDWWALYVIDDDNGYDLMVSDGYTDDVGHTLADCIEACREAYGIAFKHRRGVEPKERPSCVSDAFAL